MRVIRVTPPPSRNRSPTLRPRRRCEVDGARSEEVGEFGPPLRRYLCEGNHRLRVRVHASAEQTYDIPFAVSKPSLFHLSEWGANEKDRNNCVSEEPCHTNMTVELSPYGPDDERVRMVQRGEER